MASFTPVNQPSPAPSAPPQSPDLPTPYAQRYGVSLTYPFAADLSSGLHPRYPDRDIDDRQPIPDDGVPFPRPSDDELDRLFQEEDLQRDQFQNITTLEIQSLNDVVPVKVCDIEVDEQQWEPAFQKARWYNTNRPIGQGFAGNFVSGLSKTDIWTVDNPIIWDALKPSLQIANDLFRATFQGPFYHAVTTVNEATSEWKDAIPWNLSHPPYIARFPRNPNDTEVAELRQRFAGYAEKVVISVLPPGAIRDSLTAGFYGVTSSYQDPPGENQPNKFVLILMNPGMIWPLLDSTISPTEKALARFSFSKTLVHEMAHAMWRVHNEWSGLVGRRMIHEPFYQLGDYKQWITELGIAWESDMFGGGVSSQPGCKTPSLREQWNARFLMVSMADHPNYLYMAAKGKGVNEEQHRKDIWSQYVVPLSYTSGLFTSQFWAQRYSAYGLQAFKVPQALRYQRGLSRFSITPLNKCEKKYVTDDIRAEIDQFSEVIVNYRALKNRLRPWYREAHSEWDGSIHSFPGFRDGVMGFRDAHIQRDELAAEAIIMKGLALRPHNQWGRVMINQDRILWFRDAIAYLMLAIMPRRNQDLRLKRSNITENCWSPSNEARNFAQSQSREPWVIDAVGNNRYGTHRETVTKKHVPLEGGQKGLGDRKTLLKKLKWEATIRELNSAVPQDITDNFWAALRQAEADARVTDDEDWLPNFSLNIRGWISQKTGGHMGMASASLAAGYNGPEPVGYTQDAGEQSSGQAGPSGTSSRSAKLGRLLRRDDSWKSKYYTIGEVGNHRSREDLWAVLDDGSGGFDVYDVTEIVQSKRAGAKSFDLTTLLYKTLLGLKAVPRLQREMKGWNIPIGRLIYPVRRQEIAERDGKNGKPLWIILGQNVFSIIGVAGTKRRRDLLLSNPGGNPMPAIDLDRTRRNAPQLVLDDLWRYRCATIAERRPTAGPDSSSECLYTAKEVAWYIYPETGMYTIIGGNVYDMTNFIDSHPGGTRLIQQWAGKDSTKAFTRYHSHAKRCLDDYDFLRVGRVIREGSIPITDKEIIINGFVYDLTPVDTWVVPNWRGIQEVTRSLRGTNASEQVRADRLDGVPEDLLDLVHMRELIVAKITPPLPEVTLEQLASNDGSDIPLPEPTRELARLPPLRCPVWVCYGRNIYDVTSLHRYGDDDLRKIIEPYRGQVIPTGQLSALLEKEHSHRIIGVLSQSKRPADEVVVNESGGPGDQESPSKLHQIDLTSRAR